MSISDLSRLYLMYKFHYHYVKSKYSNKSRLLFTNTASLMYEINKPKIFMKILVRIKKCLILVIIKLNRNITMIQTT